MGERKPVACVDGLRPQPGATSRSAVWAVAAAPPTLPTRPLAVKATQTSLTQFPRVTFILWQ